MPVIVTTNGVVTTCTDVSVQDALDQRSTATYTVSEAAGAVQFENGQQVSITDNVLGTCFTGYVNDETASFKAPELVLTHDVNCIDERYLADKRVASGADDDKNMSNQYAGDNVVYLLDNYLSAEGVTASYARQFATTATDFATGTLLNVVPTSNVDNGNLELAPSGVIVSKTESTAAHWNAGTLTGAMVSGNLLQLNAHPALSFSGVCSSGYGNAYAYYKIWSGSYVIASGDLLVYKVWINSDSPTIQAGVDGICTDGTSIRDYNDGSGLGGYIFDQNGIRAHPNADLSGFANDQWYYRYIDLTKIAGKTLSYVDVSFEGDSAGTYQAYFYDVWIQATGGAVAQNLFGNQGVISPALSFPNLSAKVSNVGYANIQLNPVTAYEKTGTRVSASNSIQAAGIYQASLLSWQATTPTGTSLAVYTSVDGGTTYQPATNQTAISNIPLGALLTSRNVATKIVMSISGKDPTMTPQVSSITWTVNPAYAATQTATRQKYDTQADWNTGTFSTIGAINGMTATAGGDLTLNSFLRDWNDEILFNQTLFGGGASGFQSTFKRAGSVRATTGNVARSRLDNAGTWQDFIMSVDIQVPAANVFVGMEYRTTYWDNLPNTGAYVVDVSTTSLNIGRGTNSVTNTHTAISPSPFTFSPALNSSEWHTLTIIASGTNHKVYLDGVLYFNVTDATFGAAGNIALRIYNNSGGDQTCYWDNFGIMPTNGVYPGPGTFSGPTWTSPSISLGSFTAGNNLIFWDASTIAGDYLNVQTSFNGGAYTNATNNAPIPGIVLGTPYVSATLQIKVQMQAATAGDTPVLHGLTAWVTSQYSSSGNRISPALSLASAGRAGSTLVAWNALVPTNTTLFVDTSLDKINWTNVGSGAQGGVQIAGITAQADPVEDTFDGDTSSFYISTFQTNGAAAAWDFSTATPSASYISVSGGTTAQLLYSSFSDDEVDLVVDMDRSDAGGLVWRVFDSNNFYDLVVADASSPTPGVATLYKVTNNTRSTLATAGLTWKRGTPRRIRATMLGPLITVSFDGSQIIQYTDNFPLGAGQCGLRTDTVSGASAATFYFFRIQPQGDSVQGTTVFTRTRLTSTDPTVTPQLEDLTVSVRSPSIQSGAFIPSTTFSVLNGSTNTVAADLDDLARQSNYWWRIKNKQLFFQAHNGTLAPFILTDKDMLEPFGVSVKNFGDLYRNTPWILGGTDTLLSSGEQFTTDGTTQAFTVDYPIDSIVSITAGAQNYTFGIKGVDSGKDFYYQVGNNTINQDASEIPLPPGLKLSPVYYGQVNVVASAQNAAEVAARAALEGTSGIVEVAETAQGLNLAAAAQLAASREIQYTPLSKQLTCTTLRIGLAVGQLVSVVAPQYRLNDWQGLITNMKTFWRMSKLRGTFDAVPFFTITAVSGPLLNEWVTTLSGLGR